ncbi:hypothetical protein [Roseivivax sp. CAU 1753]
MTDIFVIGLVGLSLVTALIFALTSRKRGDDRERIDQHRSSFRRDHGKA